MSGNELKVVRIEITSIADRVPGELMHECIIVMSPLIMPMATCSS